MSNSPFHSPGDDLMRSPGLPGRAPADALTVRNKGWGGRKPPKVEAQWENPDPEPMQPIVEEKNEDQSQERALLSHPIWDQAQGHFEGTATASIDLALPKSIDLLTKVEFECWPVFEGSCADTPMKQAVHAKEGRASATFTLYRPISPENGNPVPSCDFLFSAKHSRSESMTSPALPVAPGKDEPFDGVILYSPGKDEYLVCDTEEEFKTIFESAKQLESLRKKSQQAWEVSDPSRRQAALEEVEKDSEIVFGGKSMGSAKRGVEELLLVQENKRWGRLGGWNYIAAHDRAGGDVHVKGHPRRFKAAAIQDKLDKLLKRGSKDNRKSEAITGKFKVNIFKTEPLSGQAWEWRKPTDTSAEGEPKAFSDSAEAAVFRYVAGWDGGEIAYDPHKKKLKIGASGQVSGSLFEGKATLNLDLPGPKGVNILGWLSSVKNGETFLVDPKRQCLLRLSLQGSFSAFIGATAQGALALNLERIPKEEAAVEAQAFAGGQAQVGGRGLVNWAPSPSVDFLSLGSIGYDAGLSVGIGGQAKLKIEYENCKFRFEVMGSATWGLGIKGGFTWELDAKEAWELVGHICSSVNFHFVTEITSKAHAAYTNYAYANYVAIHERNMKGVDWATTGIGNFRAWLNEMSPRIEDLKFAIFQSSLSSSILSKVPPQALGQSIITVMETRERADFSTILNLLKSTVIRRYDPLSNPTANHKLKWTLRYVSDVQIPAEGKSGREAKKKVALEKGIGIIREFGAAQGKWALNKMKEPNRDFISEFYDFLEKNGVES